MVKVRVSGKDLGPPYLVSQIFSKRNDREHIVSPQVQEKLSVRVNYNPIGALVDVSLESIDQVIELANDITGGIKISSYGSVIGPSIHLEDLTGTGKGSRAFIHGWSQYYNVSPDDLRILHADRIRLALSDSVTRILL